MKPQNEGIEALITIMQTLPLLRDSDLRYVSDALRSIIEIRKFYQVTDLKMHSSF